MDRIVIPLENGYKLIAERNTDSQYDKEIFVGIEAPSGIYWQDLAIVRPSYTLKDNDVIFKPDNFEVLVYGNSDQEDYTEQYSVDLREPDDE